MWSRRLNRLLARRIPGVETPDVRAFPTAARRTWILRLVLGGAVVALVVAAAASARDLETREEGLLPSGTVGVVVVDLSLSIADDDYYAVRRAFSRLIEEDARIGLVVFSDVPYELLPPGTAASQMRPMLRLLVPPKLGPPVNPWSQTFRAGTRISTALELARGMLERDRVESGSILLVSDLETAPDDVPALARVVRQLSASSIELRVVGVAPSSDARVIFEGLLEDGIFDAPSATDVEPVAASEASSSLPVLFLILGALFFLALAAHERFGGRLALMGGARSAA